MVVVEQAVIDGGARVADVVHIHMSGVQAVEFRNHEMPPYWCVAPILAFPQRGKGKEEELCRIGLL